MLAYEEERRSQIVDYSHGRSGHYDGKYRLFNMTHILCKVYYLKTIFISVIASWNRPDLNI